jgi:hypothetical protein
MIFERGAAPHWVVPVARDHTPIRRTLDLHWLDPPRPNGTPDGARAPGRGCRGSARRASRPRRERCGPPGRRITTRREAGSTACPRDEIRRHRRSSRSIVNRKLALRPDCRPEPDSRRKRHTRRRGEEPWQTVFAVGPALYCPRASRLPAAEAAASAGLGKQAPPAPQQWGSASNPLAMAAVLPCTDAGASRKPIVRWWTLVLVRGSRLASGDWNACLPTGAGAPVMSGNCPLGTSCFKRSRKACAGTRR